MPSQSRRTFVKSTFTNFTKLSLPAPTSANGPTTLRLIFHVLIFIAVKASNPLLVFHILILIVVAIVVFGESTPQFKDFADLLVLFPRAEV